MKDARLLEPCPHRARIVPTWMPTWRSTGGALGPERTLLGSCFFKSYVPSAPKHISLQSTLPQAFRRNLSNILNGGVLVNFFPSRNRGEINGPIHNRFPF